MTTRRSRRLGLLAAGATLALTTAGAVGAAAAPSTNNGNSHNPSADSASTTGVDQGSAIVRLSRDPLATSPATRPAPGQKIAFGSTKVKNERAALAAQRNEFRQWLRSNAPKAQVTGEYDVALNAVAVRLNGTSLAILNDGPNVVSTGYEATYTPTAADPDLSLIDAAAGAPGHAGNADAGKGVKVGIVDTGIDVTHPCFDDQGYAAQQQLGDPKFTNNKVVVAKVFANKAANQGFTAEAVQDHGTHVAGTVACNADTPASVNGVAIPYNPSGVAPGALLGNYNVFPGDITNARSEDILDALQAAVEDGMDVINMSLGGDAHGVQDLLTNAVDAIDEGANIVVAVSAGNEGPGHFTIGSPGSAERALTAGASSVGHFVGLPVTGTGVSTLAATGDFAVPAKDLSAKLTKAGSGSTLGLGCSAGDFTGTTGTIALVSRGTCSFGTKISNAEKAGAVATIVVNNVAGDPTAMGQDGVNSPTIPAVMAGLKDKAALTGLVGQTVTIGSVATYQLTGNDDIMAGFSSQGPVDVSYRVKPDLVAPGVNVLSSIPHSFCDAPPCWAFFQGTSMASPHLAGTAAVVRAAHPDWDAWQVRSGITNTATQGRLTAYQNGTTTVTDPMITGAGIDDVQAALGAKVALSSVSTSFGASPSGTGNTLSRSIAVQSLTGSAQTLKLSVTGPDAALFKVPATISVPATGSVNVPITFAPAKNTPKGDHSATLDLGGVAHSVLYAFLK